MQFFNEPILNQLNKQMQKKFVIFSVYHKNNRFWTVCNNLIITINAVLKNTSKLKVHFKGKLSYQLFI